MLFAPAASLLALTLSTAVAAPFEAAAAPSVAVPSAVVPTENVTEPVGRTLPLAGVTVAVNCAVPVAATLAAPTVTTVFVAIGVPVTVTVAEAVELLKLPVAV
jgi:hypothetical protein